MSGHVLGSLPAGEFLPSLFVRTFTIASPVDWPGKKHSRMAATFVSSSANVTFRGPALNRRTTSRALPSGDEN